MYKTRFKLKAASAARMLFDPPSAPQRIDEFNEVVRAASESHEFLILTPIGLLRDRTVIQRHTEMALGKVRGPIQI